MSNTYEIHYDTEADFLEIFFGESTKCYAEEPEEGVFVRKDEKTKEVKSIGIVGFRKRVQVLKRLMEQIGKKLPREIDISR
jgi:uncharacterized protein YuzE